MDAASLVTFASSVFYTYKMNHLSHYSRFYYPHHHHRSSSSLLFLLSLPSRGALIFSSSNLEIANFIFIVVTLFLPSYGQAVPWTCIFRNIKFSKNNRCYSSSARKLIIGNLQAFHFQKSSLKKSSLGTAGVIILSIFLSEFILTLKLNII